MIPLSRTEEFWRAFASHWFRSPFRLQRVTWCSAMTGKTSSHWRYLRLRQWWVNQACYGWPHVLTPTQPKRSVKPPDAHTQLTAQDVSFFLPAENSNFSLRRTACEYLHNCSQPTKSVSISNTLMALVTLILIFLKKNIKYLDFFK